jgi:branched-chain amino acid transport system permease protein
MLAYVIAGLVLGGIYGITAAGLTVTYLSAGILNFAFGAVAYFVARFYYYLHSQENWGLPEAAVVAVLIAGPALGILLYLGLFRHLRLSSTLIKVVATLGLAVMIPPLAALLFGNQTIFSAPGLAPQPVRVFRVLGVPVTMDQIIVYGCVLVVVIAGALILRYTDVGLRIRAMVDSAAMTSLYGANPTAVSIGVWAASTLLAGLAGVLAAPIIGLDANAYTLLMASALAAVIAAQLRHLSIAVIVGLLMGVAASLMQHYLPPSSSLTSAVIPSIPFVVTVLFLVYHVARRGRVSESAGAGGALDRAIAVRAAQLPPSPRALDSTAARHLRWLLPAATVAIAAVLPLAMSGLWMGLLATGVAYAIIFLSYTLVIGEGGMVWLCLATFAGVGGLAAGQLASVHHWPVLLAVLAGGVITLPIGVILGLVTIRMGNLYVALVTLIFGLLMENLVFTRNVFQQDGMGVIMAPPSFAQSQRAFTYLELGIFLIIGLFILNLRRSTTGLALSAVRSSEPGAKTIGISVLQMKVVIAGLAAFVAGVGGALLAVGLDVALPTNYATLTGLTWLAVLVSIGIRSNVAALAAGLVFTLFPGIVLTYLPSWFGQVPPIAFGLGAVFIAMNPDGAIATQGRQIRAALARWRGSQAPPVSRQPIAAQPVPIPAAEIKSRGSRS